MPERHAVPDTRVIYSQTTVPEPRVIMEPKTVTVQVPKTVMEPVEYTVQEPRTVMDEKSITVPKIVLEDQEITVPVPRAVQVPVQRMVPRTVMVPITTYVTQYVQETEKVCAFILVCLSAFSEAVYMYVWGILVGWQKKKTWATARSSNLCCASYMCACNMCALARCRLFSLGTCTHMYSVTETMW